MPRADKTVNVFLEGALAATFSGVKVSFDDRGLWIQEKDRSWTFRPWHSIGKITDFSQPHPD